MPNVLIVDSWQAFGGGERYVLHVVEGLGRRGVGFSVAGVDEGLLERAASAGARPLRMRFVTRQRTTLAVIKQVLMWPLLLFDYASLLRRAGRPADVHITTLEEQMLATPFYALLGRRVTWSVHGPVGVTANPIQWLLYWFAGRFVTRVIAVSSAARDTLVKIGLSPRRIEVVPHGIDLPPPSDRGQRATPVIGFVGRLEPIKDPILFLQAAEAALASGADAKFVLYGEGSQKEELERRIDERGLGDRVTLAGYVEDAASIYDEIDVMMMTSQSEGLPFALLEAGAAGIPVIVPRIAGMSDVVVEGVTGLICDRTPEALGAAVGRLAADPDLRTTMGEAARRDVTERFSSELMLDRTAAVICGPVGA